MTRLDNSLALIGLTLLAFAAGIWVHRRAGNLPILQPVLIAIFAIISFLIVSGIPYDRYLDLTAPLHALLGPAIVALAIPLYDNLRKARQALIVVFATLLIGGTLVVASGLVLGLAFRLDRMMELSLATKSVTAPIALAVAEKIGGTVPLTILSVFCSGIAGAMFTPSILRLVGVRDPLVSGFTLGITSHAFGVARSIEFGPEAVAFATLGMALMGCATAVLVPAIFRFL